MAENNPYVGPASFNEKDRQYFFGRDEEARELSYLLIARRAVLLYAQSGAGKTSLLRAKIIPDFTDSREMHVFPITRVSGPEESGNVYLANALAGLQTNGSTLTEALAPLIPQTTDADDQAPYLLIIDQFEEIFTFHPELTTHRQEFFTQLRDCLNAYPKLGLLLAMREDYLADMDSFAGYLPDRLRTRMRMERLSAKQAISAIALPAERAGKPFDEGIAERLAEDLRGVGKYVEPVQLQIVCRQLWSKLPDSAECISQLHYETLARVDDALIHFYRDSLAKAQSAALTERTLRRWFGEKLITPAGTRGLIYQGKTETEGLPNEAVSILRGAYIIRPDSRGHDVYYELAHDRLVDPILKDNLVWKAGYRNPVAEALERGPDTPLTGSALAEALRYAGDNPSELTEQEQKFLTASADQETKRLEREARERMQLIEASLLSSEGLNNSNRKVDDLGSLVAALRAERYFRFLKNPSAELAVDVHYALQQASDNALERVRIPVSSRFRLLALSKDGSRIAGLADTSEEVFLWTSGGRLIQNVRLGETRVVNAAFTLDLKLLVTIDASGAVRVWHLAGGDKIAEFNLEQELGNAPAIAIGGPYVALGSDTGLRVWDFQGNEKTVYRQYGKAEHLAFSADGGVLGWASQGAENLPERFLLSLRLDEIDPHLKVLLPDGSFPGIVRRDPISDADVETLGRLHLGWQYKIRIVDRDWTATDDGLLIRVLDADDQPIAKLRGHESYPNVEACGPGPMLLSSSGDNTIRLWDLKNIYNPKEERVSHAFSIDPSRHVSWDGKGPVELWSAERECIETLSVPPSGEIQPTLFMSPDASLVAINTESRLFLWSTTTGVSSNHDPQGFVGEVLGIGIVSEEPFLLSHDRESGSIFVYDRQGAYLRGFHLDGVGVQLSPSGRHLMCAVAGSVRTYNLEGIEVGRLTPQGSGASGDQLLRGSSLRRAAIADRQRRLIFVFDDRRIIGIFPHDGSGGELSPDGRLLISFSDFMATVWHVDTGRRFARFPHLGFLSKFTPDGKYIVRGRYNPFAYPVETIEELAIRAREWAGDHLRYNPDVSPEDRLLCEP